MAERIFNKKIKGGFMDVGEATNGNRYLKITKGKKVDDKWDNQAVFIWQDGMEEFLETLKEALPHLGMAGKEDSDLPF